MEIGGGKHGGGNWRRKPSTMETGGGAIVWLGKWEEMDSVVVVRVE
jgi:hypothetical protein